MLEIKRFVFGPFETNCYVVSDEQQVLLVDPACYTPYEQQQLYRYISNLQSSISNLQLSIVATHGHLDHLWGAKWATETWHTPVLMHEADIPMAHAMQQQYDMFGVRATAEPFPIEPLTANRLPFTVIQTPGHTPGSACLYWPEEKTLLSGDTLFQMGYGRTDLPGGNMSQLITSLEHLFTLPSDVLVYPGHGDFTTIGAEKR
ncbi:MAG: MBL fold metallo-hydrolase [Paludibacteraceae bacterium]|nr:MBL fold metallo-hydrolase [Paludibacteraceae bacterium]